MFIQFQYFHYLVFFLDWPLWYLYHSSEIEQSVDDIHAELVEDEDEEVTLQCAV